MVDFILIPLKQEVEMSTGGMKMDELNPVDHVSKITVPAIFLHADDDDLIPFSSLD